MERFNPASLRRVDSDGIECVIVDLNAGESFRAIRMVLNGYSVVVNYSG